MKVVLVIKSLSLPGGGAERILVDLAQHLVEAGHEASIVSFDHPDKASFYPIDHRVPWHRLGIGDVAQKGKLGGTLRRMLALRRILVFENPSVIVGFMHSTYVLLAASMVGTGIPIVGSEHITIDHYTTLRFEYLLLILSTFLISRFTVLSENIKASYSWFFRRKATVIKNPVFVPIIKKAERPRDNRNLVLSVGRLEPQKDHITLIKAFAQLADRYPQWDLRIVGEGSLRPRLEAEISKLDLRERISLPGPATDVGAQYAVADIFVVPSTYESFGLATAEAMGAGLPVIGFEDCPGTNEIIKDNINGILAESDNRVGNLAKAIAKLMESRDLRNQMGNEGKSAAKEFSPEMIFPKWIELLNAFARK